MLSLQYRFIWKLLFIFTFFTCFACSYQTGSTELILSAPASMTQVLQQLLPSFEKKYPHVKVQLNTASSGKLQHQIEQGAPVDLFLSAGEKEMDILKNKQLLIPDTMTPFASNALVLVQPADATSISSIQELRNGSIQRIAMGEPDIVPVGRYAKQALAYFDLWKLIQAKLVFAQDVKQVLTYVETGNVDAGLVYLTDAQSNKKVRMVQVLPSESHQPIIYYASILKRSTYPEEAHLLINDLLSEDGQRILENHGFSLVNQY